MLTPCPTAYGRRNGLKEIEQIWRWYREHTVLLDEWEWVEQFGSPEERESLRGKMKIGVFQDIERETFEERWAALVAREKL